MKREHIEIGAIKELRFRRKFKRDYHNFGYPKQFEKMIDELATTYPADTPSHWVIKRGKKSREYYDTMNDDGLIDRIIAHFEAIENMGVE